MSRRPDPPRDPIDGWPTSPSTPHPGGPNGPRVLAAIVWHWLRWPWPMPHEPQLDPTAHQWVDEFCWLRTGRRRWLLVGLWVATGMATAGTTWLLPLLAQRADVLTAGGAR